MATRKSSTPTLEHRDGCPGNRTETYDTRRPGGEAVTVTRCLDCGAALVTTTTTLGGDAGTDTTPEA